MEYIDYPYSPIKSNNIIKQRINNPYKSKIIISGKRFIKTLNNNLIKIIRKKI